MQSPIASRRMFVPSSFAHGAICSLETQLAFSTSQLCRRDSLIVLQFPASSHRASRFGANTCYPMFHCRRSAGLMSRRHSSHCSIRHSSRLWHIRFCPALPDTRWIRSSARFTTATSATTLVRSSSPRRFPSFSRASGAPPARPLRSSWNCAQHTSRRLDLFCAVYRRLCGYIGSLRGTIIFRGIPV